MNFKDIDPFDLSQVDEIVFPESFSYDTQTTFIYFLMSAEDEVLYVGQSINFISRTCAHFKGKVIKNIYRVTFFPVKSCEANNAEAHFIIKFNPRYNKTVPGNSLYLSSDKMNFSCQVFGINPEFVQKYLDVLKIEPVKGYYHINDLRRILDFHADKQ